MLEPAENHAEHCAVVAVNGVLAAGVFGADPVGPFLTGLAHHLHNAYLPDAGDAGDALLGGHQRPLLDAFRARALQELPDFLHALIRQCLTAVYRADTPAARAFQTADSVDRVLEMEWHARSAAFTLDVALGEMDIIHPGPVQAFQLEVMRALGLKSTMSPAPVAMHLTAPVQWGIVGCGWVARDYVAPAMAGSAAARLAAVCDPDPAARARIAGETTEIARHAGLADFLATPGLEAVYVATPNHLHRPVVEAAARAGKHVLCEKPMATSLADAEAMVAACRENGVRYATAFDQRFQARHRRLRELVSHGRLGEITAARVHYACWTPADWSPPTTQGTHDNWRVDPARAGGGAFIDLAPHGLDLTQMLLGEPLVETRCLLQRRVFAYPVDDGAALIGRFRSGALLLMNVAYNCPDHFPRRTLELIGTRAMAIAQDTMGQTPGGSLRLVGRRRRDDGTGDHPGGRGRFALRRRDRSVFPLPAGGRTFSLFRPKHDLHTMRLLAAAAAMGWLNRAVFLSS